MGIGSAFSRKCAAWRKEAARPDLQGKEEGGEGRGGGGGRGGGAGAEGGELAARGRSQTACVQLGKLADSQERRKEEEEGRGRARMPTMGGIRIRAERGQRSGQRPGEV